MLPTAPEELHDEARFQLLETLQHQDLMPFLITHYLKRLNWVVVSHYLGMLAYLAAALWAGVSAGLGRGAWLAQSGWAVLAWLALIPLHEGLHALAYRLQGARDIRFGGSLRQMYAYAIAHRFVVGRRGFVWLALMPTLVINGALFVLALASPSLRFFALALSLLHLSAAAGDWALLSYFWTHRRRPLYTYDDADLKTSYFYAAIHPVSE